jgi:hypothetical protein
LILEVKDSQGLGANEIIICIHEYNDLIGGAVFVDPEVEVGEWADLHERADVTEAVFEGVIGGLQMVDEPIEVLLRRVVINIDDVEVGVVHAFQGLEVLLVLVLGEDLVAHRVHAHGHLVGDLTQVVLVVQVHKLLLMQPRVIRVPH